MDRLSDTTLLALETEERERMHRAFATTETWLRSREPLLLDLARHLIEVREMSGAQVRQWVETRMDRLVEPERAVNDADGGPVATGTPVPATPSGLGLQAAYTPRERSASGALSGPDGGTTGAP